MAEKNVHTPMDDPPLSTSERNDSGSSQGQEGSMGSLKNNSEVDDTPRTEVSQKASVTEADLSSGQIPPNSMKPLNTVPQAQGVNEQINSADAAGAVEQPKPKRRIPKALMFIPLIFIIIFLILLAIRFFPGRTSVVSKKGEIVWWGFREDEAVILPIIEEYQEKNPNIKINYKRQSPVDYRERLANALAGEQGPDVFELHNSWVPMFRNYVDKAPSSVMNVDDFKNEFYPAIVSDLLTQEGVVGVPLEFDALALYVNDDIFASSARIPPTTWDQLRTLSIQLTQKDRNGLLIQSGASIGSISNIDHWQEVIALMIIQNGANLARPDDKRATAAIAYYEVISKERVWSNSFPPSTLAFAKGDVAMYFGPLWRSYEIAQINPNLRFHTVPLPQLPKNKPTDPNYSYATYWFHGVWSKGGNKDIAWDFIRFLTSEESLIKINENYKKERGVERLYPRAAMNIVYKDHPLLGSVVLLANDAKSWYLVDVDNDGSTGINSQVNSLYKSLVAAPKKSSDTVQEELSSVLAKYGISVR